MQLPLHIFEERYKLMIGECLENNREFGIVYFSGKDIMRAGSKALITAVMKRYENGELDIVTVGGTRFIITELIQDKAYLEARTIAFDDEPWEKTEILQRLAFEGINYLMELKKLTRAELERELLEASDVKKLSFLISASNAFTPAEKQKLLETTSTEKRLKSSVKALRKALERTRLTLEIQEIIKGNGDIKRLMTKHAIE
jgi:Lon protease-like protein